MAFKDEALRLNIKDQSRLKLFLSRWRKENFQAVKNLQKDRFLAAPEMQYLIGRLIGFTAGQGIDEVEAELQKQMNSWMQLRGGRVNREFIPRQIGTIIPFSRFKNHLGYHYKSFFPMGGVSRFINELSAATDPAALVEKRGLGNACIRKDESLLWFHWDTGQSFENLLELHSELVKALGWDQSWQYKQSILLIFNYHHYSDGFHPASNRGLYRPSWCDVGLEDNTTLDPDPQDRFGLVRAMSEEESRNSVRVAEAVARSAHFRLAHLEELKFC